MEVICYVFLAVHLQSYIWGSWQSAFKKTLSLQRYLNELIEDKILCMATMRDVVVLTCKKSLLERTWLKKNLPQMLLLFQDIGVMYIKYADYLELSK